MISVVTICRNERRKIQSTIDSVKDQSCTEFEWIVIDGNSTDGTVEILKSDQKRMSTFISESDTGIYNAMNKGLIHAKGEYVLFLNGGDTFAGPESLEILRKNAGPDVLYGDLAVQDRPGEVIRYPASITSDFFKTRTLPHQATAVKRSLMLQYGGFDESYQIAGDYEFFARLFQKPDRTSSHVNSVISEFGSDGISNSARYRRLRKRENHRLRWNHVPSYRGTFKCWRHILKRCVGLA